jgi:hypothetical protein
VKTGKAELSNQLRNAFAHLVNKIVLLKGWRSCFTNSSFALKSWRKSHQFRMCQVVVLMLLKVMGWGLTDDWAFSCHKPRYDPSVEQGQFRLLTKDFFSTIASVNGEMFSLVLIGGVKSCIFLWRFVNQSSCRVGVQWFYIKLIVYALNKTINALNNWLVVFTFRD